MVRRLIVSAALLTTSLVHAEPPPAAGELSVADAAKLVGFFNKLLDTMVANKSDCTKLASEIDGLVTKNAAMLKTVMKQVKDGKALPKDAENKLTERMQAASQDLVLCAADKAVNKAMARVENPDLPAAPTAAVLAQVKAPVAEDLAKYTAKIPGKGELIATISTSVGTVRCQLLADKAPLTVANFVGLATGQKPWLAPTGKLMKNKPYYDGTIFHRVIPDFMIQGGDPTGTGMGGPGYEFGDETSPDLKMAPGVLAMANSGPATNGSQFFITESSPNYLDGKHTIFGTCKPLDAVSKIARVKRDANDKPETALKMKVKISRGTL